MAASKSFLCLRVKNPGEEEGESMIIDVDDGINSYILNDWSSTDKLKSLFELLASRGTEVQFYGGHADNIESTHVLRNGVLFEELKKGENKKQFSRPVAVEIFPC